MNALFRAGSLGMILVALWAGEASAADGQMSLRTHGTSSRPQPAKRAVDVTIVTSLGSFVVRLDGERAPVTTANFLRYVDAKTYDDTEFYRTVSKRNTPAAPFEVIQGGLNPKAGNTNVPIKLEPTSRTHLSNLDGALAMARTNDPDSATTEFFVDVGDARYLDAGGPLGPGYAVFGRVVRGMSVVHKIHDANAQGESLVPPIRIVSMRRS
ncbi:MAG: peptidylprolyl isomerase [Vulcanimicrobiaceae bacterium]